MTKHDVDARGADAADRPSCWSRADSIPRPASRSHAPRASAATRSVSSTASVIDAELDAAARVAPQLGAVEHRVMQIDLGAFGGSALTDASIAVPEDGASGAAIPVTYVPARNTIFLRFALAWAEVLQAHDIFIGVNAVDYSGYPDCRPEFIDAFERMANLATRAGVEGTEPLRIRTPLIDLTKAEIIRRGAGAGRRLRHDRFLLPGGRAGPGLRPLRLLPPARGRVRGGRGAPIPPRYR